MQTTELRQAMNTWKRCSEAAGGGDGLGRDRPTSGPVRLPIALFGATGGTGRQVLAQAFEQGHEVRALVRDPTKLPKQAGLTRIVGDVLDPEATRHCVEGADAAICGLGSRHGSRADVAELVLKQLTDLSDLHQTPAVT